MSHILVLNGSARPNAFTAAMIRAFRKGAGSVGHTVTVFDLSMLNIRLSGRRQGQGTPLRTA